MTEEIVNDQVRDTDPYTATFNTDHETDEHLRVVNDTDVAMDVTVEGTDALDAQGAGDDYEVTANGATQSVAAGAVVTISNTGPWQTYRITYTVTDLTAPTTGSFIVRRIK